MIITDLRCEYLKNPICVSRQNPYLSWRCTENQTAWKILAASSDKLLQDDKGDLWNSDWIESTKCVAVEYRGRELASRQPVYWKVKLRDNRGKESQWSEVASFETALLCDEAWLNAQWISLNPASEAHASIILRRLFSIDKIPVRARVYLAGPGYSELYINSRKVSEDLLSPAPSDYSQNSYYCCYDVTEFLQTGKNCISVLLANGWLGTKKMRFQLYMLNADGAEDFIISGEDKHRVDWHLAPGPMTRASIYDGETFDAGALEDDWASPALAKLKSQRRPDIQPHCSNIQMLPQKHEPVKLLESFDAAAVTEPEPGIYVVDIGRNIAGWIRLKINEAAGRKITMRYAETLRENGFVNQDNLRSAKNTDEYICSGGTESYEPRFTYHGFRYVQLENLSSKPATNDIQGRQIGNAFETAGHFECSEQLLNRIQQMVVRTERNNHHHIPTDCPQRDERMGWLNDMTVRNETMVYNFTVRNFLAKHISDVCETRDAQGRIHDTAPRGLGLTPADPISVSFLSNAWLLYLHYGDIHTIEQNFAAYVVWVDYLLSRADNFILGYSYYGDWAPPAEYAVKGSIGASAGNAYAPGDFISTGCLIMYCDYLAKMAAVLDKPDSTEKYEALACKTRTAFHAAFWNQEKEEYKVNSQSTNAFALHCGAVPKELKTRVGALLHEAVIEADFHLTTGNICTKYVLEQLCEYGYVDTAFRITTQTTYPSWGFMLEKGATSLWERWEYATGGAMNSHNHPMLGSISAWLFKYLAGIRLADDSCGADKLIIKPCVPDGLENVTATYDSPAGAIKSSWEKCDAGIVFDIEIPACTTAEIILPNYHDNVQSGKYTITSKI